MLSTLIFILVLTAGMVLYLVRSVRKERRLAAERDAATRAWKLSRSDTEPFATSARLTQLRRNAAMHRRYGIVTPPAPAQPTSSAQQQARQAIADDAALYWPLRRAEIEAQTADLVEAAPLFASGKGGDFGGAGASGSWDESQNALVNGAECPAPQQREDTAAAAAEYACVSSDPPPAPSPSYDPAPPPDVSSN